MLIEAEATPNGRKITAFFPYAEVTLEAVWRRYDFEGRVGPKVEALAIYLGEHLCDILEADQAVRCYSKYVSDWLHKNHEYELQAQIIEDECLSDYRHEYTGGIE